MRLGPEMLLVAHRGDLSAFPEDTAEAIAAASAATADGIEFDVHRSADGTWWVIHDRTLDRTTDAAGPIARLRDVAIQRALVDGGFGFDPERHHGLRVPTLASVLDSLDDYSGEIFIDLQHAEAGSVAELLALLGPHRYSILCRTVEDVEGVESARPDVTTYLRSHDMGGVVDGWLADARWEVTREDVRGSTSPIAVFVPESWYPADEFVLVRRAWSLGVAYFLTKDLPNAQRELVALRNGHQ